MTNRPPPESAAIFNDLPDISFTDAASRSDLLATFTNILGSFSVAAGIEPTAPSPSPFHRPSDTHSSSGFSPIPQPSPTTPMLQTPLPLTLTHPSHPSANPKWISSQTSSTPTNPPTPSNPLCPPAYPTISPPRPSLMPPRPTVTPYSLTKHSSHLCTHYDQVWQQ